MSDDQQDILSQLKANEAERERLLAQLRSGTIDSQIELRDHARANAVVGINFGTIVFGHRPSDDEARRLGWYLDSLAGTFRRLPLRGISEPLDRGDGLSLPRLYVLLATESRWMVADSDHASLDEYFTSDGWKQLSQAHSWSISDVAPQLKREYSPITALPDKAIVTTSAAPKQDWATRFYVYRAILATESLSANPRLVLLGDPGSGKSTFLRHVAWSLAQRGLERTSAETTLLGWPDDTSLLPIILPLRQLAGTILNRGATAKTVFGALLEVMQGYCAVAKIDDTLNAAAHNKDAALVMFDGLDEVPATGIPGHAADRATTLAAVRDFAEKFPQARIVITSRTRAFDEKIRAELGWPVETLAPFTLGQVRHFMKAWYRELVGTGQVTVEQAERYEHQLVAAIEYSNKLRAMSGSPLLLTMMALVLYNRGSLPRDRPELYEAILELLLSKWDEVRGGESLADIIGDPKWGSREIRPLINRLSYIAHRDATSADGRGSLSQSAVRDALITFFDDAGMADAWRVAQRCQEYFVHRSGLIVPDDTQDSFVFAHLTLQEHCAGSYLLKSPDAAALVRSHRGDDRWREPILLGLGVVQDSNPALVDQVLTDLIDNEEGGRPKPIERWQHDLILAAEIGDDRDWVILAANQVNTNRLQRDLRKGLVHLLADPRQPLPATDRVRAGFLLGDLGDPRFPVTIDAWKREAEHAVNGTANGYFCRVDAGTYVIGSTDNDPDAGDEEKPRHAVTFAAPFWIGRYPITNDQWQAWVEAGGRGTHAMSDSDLNRRNQPAVWLDSHMATDFCAWLSAQLDLTQFGLEVRLPTEFEWEAAARGGGDRCYPWGNDWAPDHAASAENRDTRGWMWTVPVGCFAAGAAPCGALDMAGNVWEWTSSEWKSYPGSKKRFHEKDWVVFRGGSWGSTPDTCRCGARFGVLPDYDFVNSGVRVVLAPPLASS